MPDLIHWLMLTAGLALAFAAGRWSVTRTSEPEGRATAAIREAAAYPTTPYPSPVTRRATAADEMAAKLTALGIDDDALEALGFLAACGMPADGIRRVAKHYCRGYLVALVGEHPGAPYVYGIMRIPVLDTRRGAGNGAA